MLESKIASIVWFDKIFRSQLLERKYRVGLLNEGVDENRHFLNLTFRSNITNENYATVEENIKNSCRSYVTQARSIIDLIEKTKKVEQREGWRKRLIIIFKTMKIRSENELDMIRGKMLVGNATIKELHDFLTYVNALEALVEEASMEDFYGTEGWRHRMGWDD